MKADEYRYWQSRPVHERLDAIEEMIQTAYALKGWEIEPDVPRLQRPFMPMALIVPVNAQGTYTALGSHP
jgi:hypothetical protein